MGRAAVRLRSLVSAVVFGLALAGPMAASADADTAKPTLTLREVGGSAGERTYQADLRVGGTHVSGADLDIGGLGSDPDLRVPTQSMTEASDSYRATLNFSSGGDWVLVVRAHAPVQIVELFTVKVDGIAVADHATAAASPSRQAMRRLDPTYAAASSSGDSAHGGGAAVQSATTERRSFDLEAALFRALHSFGAVAWLVSVLGLVIANRLGPGRGRDQLLAFIAERYTVLAGVGLSVVVFTGLINMQRSSAGLFQPTKLLETGVGTAYLCVFAVKMVATAASLYTSMRIGRLLSPSSPSAGRRVGSKRPRFAGAPFLGAPSARRARRHPGAFSMPDVAASPFPATSGAAPEYPSGYEASEKRVFRMAETNVTIGACILIAVAILGQLHGLIH